MEQLSDTLHQNNVDICLYENVPDGVNGYFREEGTHNIEVEVTCHFPSQDLSSHSFFINFDFINIFLDENSLILEHISDLPYNRFECFICMGGSEHQLYTHKGSSAMHFHKPCYQKVKTAIDQIIERNSNILAIKQL